MCITILVSTCLGRTESVASKGHFFDIKSFIAKEQERLKDLKGVIKKATINGIIEEKTIIDVNLKEELALFIDSDINKLAWLDKYDVDSTFSDKTLTQITYTAKNDRLKTSQMKIHLTTRGIVEDIVISRKTSSIAAKLEQKLHYIPAKGYSIESSQQTSLSKIHVLELDVQFVN